MSLEAAMKFVAKMNDDDALKDKVADAIDGKSEKDAATTFVALGKANGFDFTADEAIVLRDRAIAVMSGEMSNADLAGVAGGGIAIPGKAGAAAAGQKIGSAVVGASNTVAGGINSAASSVTSAFRNISSY